MPHPFPNLSPELRGHVHWLRHESTVLKSNPWGDPAERDLIVYTPPDHDPAERLPAILVLIGYSGTGEKLLARSMTGVSLATRIDRLVRDGSPRFVAVMPDCMTSMGGSQYVDSPGLGRYASYLVDEIRPAVEAQFPGVSAWGVMGHSSGGFGALHLAMNHPGAFGAAACHSGDLGFDLCYLGDLAKALQGVEQLGGLERVVDAFWSQESPPGAAFAAMNILCMACAYSPDPGATPIPAQLPLDFEWGTVRHEVLERWRRFDPVVQVDDPEKRAALAALKGLWIDCGSRDEYGLHYGARQLGRKLDRHGVPHRLELFEGRHGGVRYRWDASLPWLASRLTQEAP